MAATHSDHLVNFEAFKMAQRSLSKIGACAEFWPPLDHAKQAFVPAGGGGDPSQGGGAPPGGPPGGDPSGGMGGGAPQGPPPGGDPSGGGGGGGGGGDLLSQLMPAIQQAVQTAMQAGGGGGAGGPPGSGAALKPKIDVNVEIMQMKNLLAKIVDHLGIPVPAQDMTATSDKLMAMSQGQSTQTPMPGGGGGDPSGGAGGGAIGGMAPMQPMQGAGTPGMEQKAGSFGGTAFDGNAFMSTAGHATALLTRRALREAAAA